MDLLRFITAGSVDDGKSTLIGRLLFDSKSILADQLEALERSSRRREDGQVDLALLTDGLRAEREQGITIDVAYRYFSTPRRKFIIADAPGHIQYTRNMITGASHAELVVILVDARHGVVEQTRRHSIIASMLRIPRVVVAINKMDLIGFDEGAYNRIVEDYREVASRLGLTDVTYIPISALRGDNIVDASTSMPWYEGPSLLRHLEEVEVPDPAADARPRFQVQYVIRPQTADLPDYRGYAGRIAGGVYRKGDAVTVLPLNAATRIARIEVAGREVEEAWAPQSVVLHLEDDIDVGRGDAIIPSDHLPEVRQEFDVMLCWLDEKPLRAGNRYLLQQNSRLVRAVVRSLEHRVDVNTLDALPAGESIGLNEVVRARLRTAAPLACDPFERLPANGSAILIDETGNGTVAAVLFQS
ncbi:MAG: sulfate adenylyltransferase [Chitinophagia bacterium]|nr:sulfate adenylyltransferase [Chitinophagia bacterium]